MPITLGSQAVGTVVKLNVNSTPTNFIVVNQGIPQDSPLYDESCNGTWLLMQNIYENRQWNSSDVNDYANSTINTWLNGTFLGLLDEDIQAAIPQVKIPYRPGSGTSSAVNSGANGLPVKVFLLGGYEVGWTTSDNSYFPVDGARLDYFLSGTGSSANTKRVATLNGGAARWWLRSPYRYFSRSAWSVGSDGSSSIYYCSYSYGVRPALILPSSLFVDDDGFVVTNQPPTAPGSIDVTGVVIGEQATVTLTAATDPDGTVESYIYERLVDGGTGWQQIANVNSLTQTDTISAEWGTVQYRACAVDNNGVSGPYVTSEVFDVNAGWVIVAGPSSNLGNQPAPFSFNFSVSVTGQTSVSGISAAVALDSANIYTGTLDSGQSVGLVIDTRILTPGSHTILVTAEAELYEPASSTYTFTIPAIPLPSGGRAEQAQNENAVPMFFQTLASLVYGAGGQDLNTIIAALQLRAVQMEYGTYVGTGKYGESNPNSLTFNFDPVCVIAGRSAVLDRSSATQGCIIALKGTTVSASGVSSCIIDGNTMTWYSTHSPGCQINSSGVTYGYIALGLKEGTA